MYNVIGTLNSNGQIDGRLNGNARVTGALNNSVVAQSSIAQYPSIDDFPETGSSKILYIDQSTLKAYVWFDDDYSSISGGGGIESISVNDIQIEPVNNNVNIAFGEDFAASEQGVVSLLKANSVEQDNTRPITAAAVYTEVGNINALLATI